MFKVIACQGEEYRSMYSLSDSVNDPKKINVVKISLWSPCFLKDNFNKKIFEFLGIKKMTKFLDFSQEIYLGHRTQISINRPLDS